MDILVELDYLKPENGRQTFKIVTLNKKKAELLNLKKNDVILEVKRTLHFPEIKNDYQ